MRVLFLIESLLLSYLGFAVPFDWYIPRLVFSDGSIFGGFTSVLLKWDTILGPIGVVVAIASLCVNNTDELDDGKFTKFLTKVSILYGAVLVCSVL